MGLALELQRVFKVKARSGNVHKPVCCVCVAAPEGTGFCVVQGEEGWLHHCVCWLCIVPRNLGPGGESLRSVSAGREAQGECTSHSWWELFMRECLYSRRSTGSRVTWAFMTLG